MLVVVVIIFMLSWLPLYAIFIRIKLGNEQMEPWEGVLLAYATPVAQWLGASNSCINPILYAYFNQKYRRGFTAIIQSGSCCGTIRTTVADYEHRYVTTSEVHNASFARNKRDTSAKRSSNPAVFANANESTGDDNSANSRNSSTVMNNTHQNRRDDRQHQSILNGNVVNTQDSIELNAIHRKWKAQVL